jgi:hypothetical protein
MAAIDPGSQRRAAKARLSNLPFSPGMRSWAVDVAFVLTVSVSVNGPAPFNVNVGGANVHETWAGNVPQEKSMVPVYPPFGVIVMTNCPELPG